MIEISKTIFYNRFLIPIITPEPEYILTLGGRNITDYLNNLILYFGKIILELGKEL
jgi:hypothetical protein